MSWPVRISHSFAEYDTYAVALFHGLVTDRQLAVIREEGWPTDCEVIPPTFGERLFVYQDGENQTHIYETAEGIIYANLKGGNVWLRIAAANEENVAMSLDMVAASMPKSEPADKTIPLLFWTSSATRPSSRRIAVTAWDDIEDNYNDEVRGQLGRFMRDFTPAESGRLVLWQGPPGTGKTWALRALGWEWREWASLHYVTDPEKLFGGGDYLLRVLGDDSDIEKWRVLVLEDMGEVMATDAKERAGQGLSRLLNTVDGLLGQGCKIMILVTTNEELRKLHPAVSRPGRCVSRVTFGSLSVTEAAVWLNERGHDSSALDGAATLAELYAILSGNDNGVTTSVAYGFSMA